MLADASIAAYTLYFVLLHNLAPDSKCFMHFVAPPLHCRYEALDAEGKDVANISKHLIDPALYQQVVCMGQ